MYEALELTLRTVKMGWGGFKGKTEEQPYRAKTQFSVEKGLLR